jgi:hypothetical protein
MSITQSQSIRGGRWLYYVGYGVAVVIMVSPILAYCIYAARDDDQGAYWYMAPLTTGYYVQNYNPPPPQPDSLFDPYQVVGHPGGSEEINGQPVHDPKFDKINASMAPFPVRDEGPVSTDFVPNVETLAVVQNQFIVGKRRSGYFFLDTTEPSVKLFRSHKEYQSALSEKGLTVPVLVNPDELASKFPGRVISPWYYQAMGERWGWTDIDWSWEIKCAGGSAAVIVGLATPRIRRWKRLITRWLFAGAVGMAIGMLVSGQANEMIPWFNDNFLGDLDRLSELSVYPLAAMLSGDFANGIGNLAYRILHRKAVA